jgi:hypothetical protein
MNKRVFLIGLAGGLLVSVALYQPLYLYLPSRFVEGWPDANAQAATIWTALAAILLLATGVFAARSSGTSSRFAATGAGAAAGLTAALLAEIFIGGAAAGVWGSRLMLAHGLHATQDETEFMFLLTHGVVSTIWWTYASIWIATAAGVLLGALGGFAAGPGGKPARSAPELWLVVSGTGILASALSLAVMTTVYQLLGPITQRAAEQASISLPYPSETILHWPVATNLAWLIFWQLTGWLVLRKYPANRNASFLNRAILVILGAFILMYFFFLFTPVSISAPVKSIVAALILLALCFGILWLVMHKMLPLSTLRRDTNAISQRNRGRGFFSRFGDARRAAWYFLAVAMLTTLILFWTNLQLLRLVWVDSALAIGILLALLGLRDTRNAVPDIEEARPAISVRDYFANSALSVLFPVLITTFNALASLSIVLIPIVMIAVLMLHDEASVLAQTHGQTLPGIVQSSYLYPIAYPLVMGVFLIISITFSAAYRIYWHKRLLRFAPAETPTQQETE